MFFSVHWGVDGKEILNILVQWEGVSGKKEVEVKEYLRQLFLHSAMLSFCKSPNLHDSWGIKKERSKPENQGPLILLWQWIHILCDTGWITMPLLSVPLILNAWKGEIMESNLEEFAQCFVNINHWKHMK